MSDDYELTITNHPSIENDPTRPGKKLYRDGVPVPLFPEQRCLRFNGQAAAFATAESGELRILYFGMGGTLPDSIKAEFQLIAEKEFGVSVEQTITPKQPPPDNDEWQT